LNCLTALTGSVLTGPGSRGHQGRMRLPVCRWEGVEFETEVRHAVTSRIDLDIPHEVMAQTAEDRGRLLDSGLLDVLDDDW